ncbi:MAG: hypothetical protein R3C01_16445 [Planctomycetaceae bacterium]
MGAAKLPRVHKPHARISGLQFDPGQGVTAAKLFGFQRYHQPVGERGVMTRVTHPVRGCEEARSEILGSRTIPPAHMQNE